MVRKYGLTVRAVNDWAKAELEHVGRIPSMAHDDIRYSYAMSTVNGMLHLRQAIKELVHDEKDDMQREELLKTHSAVVRTIKQLIKDYNVDVDTIKRFNTRAVIESYDFLIGNNYTGGYKKTRKNYKRGGSEINTPYSKNVKKNKNTRNIVTKKN